jgi:hypothetical protein
MSRIYGILANNILELICGKIKSYMLSIVINCGNELNSDPIC